MSNELKIVLDADVSKAIAGVQNLSKVIAGDFTKAINSASASASNLSADVAASVQKINASLAGLKVTSLDVSVNTASIDESLKSIQSKFAALVDPQIDVLANTEIAEAKIKELLADLSSLKGSEIFIRANDTQALQAINEVENELKGILDRQIRIGIDPTNINASVQKINSILAGLKISAVDTSAIDASIKNIQAKFNTLVDPQVNILANTELAEAKVKELITDLSNLRGSEIFIRANDSQALKVINEVETELKGILDKQVRINVNATGITDVAQRIKALEQSLINLEALKVAPDISSTQLRLFEANIKRVKTEIASLKSQATVIPIGVDTTKAQINVNLLSDTIETLRAKAESKKFFITTETDITKIAAYNKEIQKLEDEVRRLQNVGKKGFELFIVPNQTIQSVKSLTQSVAAFGGGVKTFIPPAIAGFNKLPSSISPVITQLKALEKQSVVTGTATSNAFSKAFQGVKSLAALIPGIGLGGLIGIVATAVNSLTQGFFDAAFGASKLDKAIDAASQSIDSNAASVVVMVKALQSGSLTSEEFRKVKAQLIAQAPEFQKSFDGDKISIEASDAALQKYIKQLTTTIRVTAALGIVNDTLAKSLKAIAKGEDISFGEKLQALFEGGFSGLNAVSKAAETSGKNVQKALESFNPENISKLIDDTFKKLGITFKDFAGTVDDKALKAQLDKIKAAFEKFQNETISKAQQFKKQFGDTFILPELETSFFVSKDQVFKNALSVLEAVRKDLAQRASLKELKLKLPVIIESSQVKETVTKDIESLNKVIQLLKPVELKTTGNLDELKKQLEGLDSKEVSISIKQTGDVKQIAEQLTNLKGVEIPIVIEQQGDVKKIVTQLNTLKGVDIPIKITGEVETVINQLSKIKGVDVQVRLDQANALKEIARLTEGKELPIIVDTNGIIFSITKAVDGAIKIVKTKTIKIPIVTESDIQIAEGLAKEVEISKTIIDNFFKDIQVERNIPVVITPDLSLSKGALDQIDKKLDLRQRFSVLGDLGLSEFNKIDFSNINKGIAEATKRLEGMMAIATTLNQTIGQGLTSAFNSAFDAALEGKNVFKALGEGLKQLIANTIKAIAQMLILKFVTNLIFPGAGSLRGLGVGGIGVGFGGLGGAANFGQLSGIGNRAFNNVLQVNVNGQISGDTILLAGQRAANSQGRFG